MNNILRFLAILLMLISLSACAYEGYYGGYYDEPGYGYYGGYYGHHYDGDRDRDHSGGHHSGGNYGDEDRR